ncbi:helix-turn-helix domain-containing protein [Sphingomonas sp. C3-2]|uniref:helix-turn-helix domain-containing protein n=1 Tax=Sphingomonas sp. C3-2 TaxID=3062169 RepID=UPI00294B5FF7|nr:cupin domain-containing protein [Sphingomonas sp. C3-2]WOK37529.1 cupin domain-containing protein [Sphingomonas sp. C3-2]
MLGTKSEKRPQLPLGERIRARRKELGLTLRELSETSGLSAPFISQAERDLTTPSLISLLALAKALDVDLSYFMTIPEDTQIVHRAANPKVIAVDSPVVYHDLSSQLENRRLDVMHIRIPPGHVFPVGRRNGEAVYYLLEGELHVTVGQTKAVLKPGDSMHFDSRLPHCARNVSDQAALLLFVGSPSEFVIQTRK